jgi:hypothetical protein
MNRLLKITLVLLSIHHINSKPTIEVSKQLFNDAMWVHHCEGDPWNYNTTNYKGGLGWAPATWEMFRLSWMPKTMNLATIKEQAWALGMFAKKYYMPDKNNTCAGY